MGNLFLLYLLFFIDAGNSIRYILSKTNPDS